MTTKLPTSGDDIRAAFLRFFEERGHQVVPSSSLIPAGDRTLLLTSAGMVQFKPYFTGEETPSNPRLASAQKCFRTTDIDVVGDLTHNTFFEMLGNFSVGDYFKQDAIKWGWEFLTQNLGIAPERLWATVYLDDDEAYDIWHDKVGVPAERIVRLGEKDNFWGPAGTEGPCGPSSEIHYDFGERVAPGAKVGDEGADNRFVEIWNLVFVQFYQDPAGQRTLLPAPSIDTGMGLERITAIVRGAPSIYETDLLAPVVEAVERIAGKRYGEGEATDYAIRVVAEHSRAAAFLIADGVVPSNEGRGYVLRRVIRRAVRFSRQLGIEGGFMPGVAEVVVERMGANYPELAERRAFLLRAIEQEEEQFERAYVTGASRLEGAIASRETHGRAIPDIANIIDDRLPGANNVASILGAHGFAGSDSTLTPDERSGYEHAVEIVSALAERLANVVDARDEGLIALRRADLEGWPHSIAGSEAFYLFDSFGFPLELTQEIAREHGLAVDVDGFQREMEAQRQRGRAAAGGLDGWRDAQRRYEGLAVATQFLGYDALDAHTTVVGMLKDGEPVSKASAGDEVELVLTATTFYPEGGGQVGDTGQVEGDGVRLDVSGTHRPIADLIVHDARVAEGTLRVGDGVRTAVHAARRADVMRNHTATHMLHAVLRSVLGTHVRQAGSLVAPDRLRFDFSHVAPVSDDEVAAIQRIVNEAVRDDLTCAKAEGGYHDVTADGALAFVGDRYPERVRTVRIGDAGGPFSYEVCGGTHIDRTGEIGSFRITSESGLGTGVRRIEAVTGRGAEAWVDGRLATLDGVSAKFNTQSGELPRFVDTLLTELADARKVIAASNRDTARQESDDLLSQRRAVNGVAMVAAATTSPDVDTMRQMGDRLRDKLVSGIVVLGGVFDDRPSLIAMVTADLVAKGYKAGDIVKTAAQRMGGGGGGRPDSAQAGGSDASKLGEAIEAAVEAVRERSR